MMGNIMFCSAWIKQHYVLTGMDQTMHNDVANSYGFIITGHALP
jgi:hypothetical protein